jgi:hypothetical protein
MSPGGFDEWAKATCATAADVDDLPRRDPPGVAPEWPTLRPEALYGLPGRVVETLDPYTEADPVATLITFVTAAGNMLGARPRAVAGEDPHPARLSTVLVGQTSSGRKGSSQGAPMRILEAVDPEWAKYCVAPGGLSSGEGLISHVRDAREEQQPIKEKGRVVGYEPVMVDHGVTDKRLLVVESEFAAVLKRMDREANSLSAVMRQAWDRGTLRTLTKNSPLQATDAHISMIAHITPNELRLHLAESERVNGWANRLLFFLVRRSKALPNPRPVPDAMLAPMVRDLTRARQAAATLEVLERDSDAEHDWERVYPALTAERSGLTGALVARAAAHVLRLSVAYALLDAAPCIRREHLRAALAVWGYAEASALSIFGDSLGDPVADTIERALRARGPLTRNEIRDIFQRHVGSERIDAALRLLESGGRARRTTRETAGRPAEVWEAISA